MLYEIMKKQYLKPYFVSTCHAGSLFGIISADGTVHPCEILDKPLGNLKDFNYDFISSCFTYEYNSFSNNVFLN